MKLRKWVAAWTAGLLLHAPLADAMVVGLAPIQYTDYRDFSQVFHDNAIGGNFGLGGNLVPGHESWWGDPAAGTCATCGPTTAADAFYWFAQKYAGYGNIDRLAQAWDGTAWQVATPGIVIEELMLGIGAHDSWNPGLGTPFPGTLSDADYVLAQRDFVARRGARLMLEYDPDPGFDDMVAALRAGKAIEFSNRPRPTVTEAGHWFAVSGARTDVFRDFDGNGLFDAGFDEWLDDYNGNGLFDRYLFIDNPWPDAAMQGWSVYSLAADGNFYLDGDPRPLDSVVFLQVPEPGTLLLLGLGLLPLLGGGGRGRRAARIAIGVAPGA